MIIPNVPLFNQTEGRVEYADIVFPVPSELVRIWQRGWCPMLQGSDEEDSHWNWRELLADSTRWKLSQSYAIVLHQKVQGLMIVKFGYTSIIGKELAYVDRLATAPWNRSAITNAPRYVGVGKTLLRMAIFESQANGYGGRVGLHALPGAEAFYRKCGMVDHGEDPNYENLHYFEFSATLASKFLASA